MGLRGYSETSVTNYQSTLRNIPQERRSHLHRAGSLKYCTKWLCFISVCFCGFIGKQEIVVSLSFINFNIFCLNRQGGCG